MSAVIVEEVGGQLTMTPGKLRRPRCPPNGALVAIDAAGVNPVDIGNAADNSWSSVAAPYVVGYEFAGRVVELSPGVEHVRPGDAVWGLLPVRGTRWGAYAEIVGAAAGFVARRPAQLTAAEAACFPLAGGTALQTLDRLNLPPGSWLLVHGAAGGVGHLLVQLAAQRDLKIAAALRPEQAARMTALGVTLQLPRDAAQPAALAEAELGHELDGVVDLVGGLLQSSLPHVRVGGQVATIVDLDGHFSEALDRNLTVHGVLIQPGQELLRQLADAVTAGLRPTVSATLPLAQASVAHDKLRAGRVDGKLVLTVS